MTVAARDGLRDRVVGELVAAGFEVRGGRACPRDS